MQIVPETSSRLPAIVGTLVALGAAFFVFRKLRPRNKGLKIGLWTLLFAALLWMGVFIALPTPSARDICRMNVHRRWSLFRDPNVLNYERVGVEYNPDIILPSTPLGTVMTSAFPTDIHVELSHEGRVSINNATLGGGMLQNIVYARLAKYGQFRCFVWADKRVQPQQKERLLARLVEYGCAPVYYVGIRYDAGKKKTDFVVTPFTVDMNE